MNGPITVAARSKAWTFFAQSNHGIVVSNSTWGMDVCVRILCLCMQVEAFFLIGIVGGGVQLDPLGTAATNRPIVPAPGDYYDGEIGGMIGRRNRSTRRKPAPPQTPHASRTRTRAAAVGNQRLTAWAAALPGRPCDGLIPRPSSPIDCVKRLRNWKGGRGPTKGCRALERYTRILMNGIWYHFNHVSSSPVTPYISVSYLRRLNSLIRTRPGTHVFFNFLQVRVQKKKESLSVTSRLHISPHTSFSGLNK
jgi:hypothetical protein